MTARAYAIGLSILLLIISAQAAAADLTDVQFAALPGNRVEIQLILSGSVAAPETFSTESPARIALDFPGVTSKLASKSVPIGVGPVHSLVAVDASDRTRVVLNLTDSVPYEVSTSGNRVTIQVNTQGSVVSAPPEAPLTASQVDDARTSQPPPAWSPRSRPARSAASGPALRDVDFRRGTSGEGRVVIRLPSSDTRVTLREQGSRVFVDLHDTTLPQRLFRRLDVMDFGTPVTAIESRPSGRNVEVEVQTEGDFDHMAYQTDEFFTLDFRPLTPAEKEDMARQKVVYEGDRLSLNFQDIEVRAVLQVLADFTDMNLVASDSVQGNITLRLKNVPWDQALDLILKSARPQLAMRQDGNVIMVAPAKELADQEQVEMESQQKFEDLSPLEIEFIQIKYGKASEIAAVIMGTAKFVSQEALSGSGSRSIKGDQGRLGRFDVNESGNGKLSGQRSSQISNMRGILSARGAVTSDDRTNTLIVQDTRSSLDRIRALVETNLDVPVRQVMIESRVVIANNNFARDLGVRFGVSGSMGSIGSNEMLVAGGQPGSLAVGGFDKGPFGLNADTGTPYNSGLIDNAGNQTLITNLPAIDPSGSINLLIGKIGSYLLQLELSAMQREGRGEIVSSPRVITSDQAPAVIEVGKDIPVTTPGGANEPPTVTYIPATLKLDVTPRITPDNRVIMDLVVNKDEPDFSFTVQGNPLINKRLVNTSVLVDNGETVVLGGVFEREKSFQKEQVPWLGDVPVLGRLFKNEARLDNNSELLIFVTPKILKGDVAAAP